MLKVNSKTKFFILLILFGLAVMVWLSVFETEESQFLEVVFFDVGQGDSIFIETPGRKQVLIDGGPDSTVLERLNEAMLFFDRTLDLVILTHPDSDHLTGLISVLENYKVRQIIVSDIKADNSMYNYWRELIREKNIPVLLAESGQKIILGNYQESDEIALKILWPNPAHSGFSKDTNNFSVVSQLDYEDIEVLLPGDISEQVEKILVRTAGEQLESEILKISHHGSNKSSSREFIEAVSPKAAVISVGADNRFGHPTKETLDRLKSIQVLRTDLNGSIKVLVDKGSFEIEAER